MGKLRKCFLLIVAIITLATISCQGAGETNTLPNVLENNLPIIEADDEHWQVERNDGAMPMEYEIHAGNGFVLDLSDYEIQIPSSLNITQPNMIQIILDQDIYYVDWVAEQTSYMFTADTLKPLQTSKPFSELTSGQKAIVAVGFVDNDGQGAFYPLWYAIATVK